MRHLFPRRTFFVLIKKVQNALLHKLAIILQEKTVDIESETKARRERPESRNASTDCGNIVVFRIFQ